MVVDAALSEQDNILEALVMFDDMMKVGMTFTANVLKGLNFEAGLGRMLGAAFRIDLAVFDHRFEPGQVFVVVRDNNLVVQSIPRCG